MTIAGPDTLATVHHAFVDPMRRTGRAPDRATVAAALGSSLTELDATLNLLEAAHGIVLDPRSGEPWLLHPFSVFPTATWVEKDGLGWWAPCLWCAFGIVGLVGGGARIHTRIAAQSEPIVITVEDGQVIEKDLCVHFATPPRDAWNNVHQFCASVLCFRQPADALDWSRRHGLPHGETAPVEQICRLGLDWYARHGDEDWRKWTGAEAAMIFDRAGLTGPFWRFEHSDTPF